MIVSLSGRPGSGKSTIAEMLKEKLGFENRYYMGGMRRKMAKDRGMTLDEFNSLGEKEEFTDKDVDEYQRKLGEQEDNFIIEGRTSYYFIPHSVKIYVDVNPQVGAERIYKSSKEQMDARNEGDYKSIDDVLRQVEVRMESDRKRYREIYGIKDCYDHDNFDHVVDSSNMTPNQVVDNILNYLKEQGHIE
jgi:cytidylate kinase